MTKIIVLTPIKNEDWILEQFLTVTSLFADCIVVADQLSTDRSREICAAFPKVHLITNDKENYGEDERQILLIETARKLFPDDKRILMGLDADEIFAADSLQQQATWDRIRNLPPGTSLHFERTDMIFNNNKCIRGDQYHQYFPLGYVDDGHAHEPDIIHSRRVPCNPAGETVYIEEIKILHFLYSRMKVRYAKIRFYSVIENVNRSSSTYVRRYKYNADEMKKIRNSSRVKPVPVKWLREWEEMGINLKNFYEPEFSWQDFEVLEHFRNYGYKRFHTDDIWYFDWEACREEAAKHGREIPPAPIERPGTFIQQALKLIDNLYLLSRRLRLKPLRA